MIPLGYNAMLVTTLLRNMCKIVWEKFVSGNLFHVKKFVLKYFCLLNLLTVKNYLVEVLPLVLCYKVLCKQFIQARTHGL